MWPFKNKHEHAFVAKKCKYPIVVLKPHAGKYFDINNPVYDELVGTAILFECDCGATATKKLEGKYEIWEGVEVRIKST